MMALFVTPKFFVQYTLSGISGIISQTVMARNEVLGVRSKGDRAQVNDINPG